jgi:serine/threonine protein kinase
MAETYEAIRSGPSGFAQHVCLKLVLPFFRDNEDFVRLFEREARLAAKLRHSNIVGVIDFGEVDGTPYMALELVDGADLGVLLEAQDGKRLPHELVALLGHDLAAALEHAHAPGSGRDADGSEIHAIVHRDISPGNVLISRRGEVLLSDFGVAKAISGTSRKQSAVKGKVPYMSPEQLRAEPLDGRADLFALGVVLFEALGGQRPYDGAHDPATIMLTLSGDHASLRGLAPGAPPELCDVIESLLRPNRNERPENASVLIDLLDEFVPSPRARREVGKLVAQCRPAEDRISTEDALALAAGAAATDAVPAATDTGIQHTGSAPAAAGTPQLGLQDRGSGGRMKRRFGRMLAGALLITGVVAAGAVALWPAQPHQDDESALPSALEVDPERASSADEDLGNTDLGNTDPGNTEDETEGANDREEKAGTAPAVEVDDAAQPTAIEPRPARLSVVVFPWGKVWINGKLYGPAPVKSQPLKPGRYKISAGQEIPFKSQTIRLRPGQRKSLDFDLTK